MSQYSNTTTYTTVQGDTFGGIAYKLYGNEFLATDIYALNGRRSGTLIFDDNVKLKVPIYDNTTDKSAQAPWRQAEDEG